MTIQVAVLCDAATEYNGKLNLLGTFDTLYAPKLPAHHPRCSVAIRIAFDRNEEGPHHLHIHFVDEDGQRIIQSTEVPVEVAFPPDATFISRNFIVNFQQLKFDKTGLYSVDLVLDDRQLCSIPLAVKMMDQEGGLAGMFSDFPEQSRVTQLLQRSLERDRLAHAYLFGGNSLKELEDMARTLAKTVNCLSPPERAAKPFGPGFLRCLRQLPPHRHLQSSRRALGPAGVEVAHHRHRTNSGVDANGQLEADGGGVQSGNHRGGGPVEPQAANAFLKTLEEPPAKSILILLSTEPQRLLETILSR